MVYKDTYGVEYSDDRKTLLKYSNQHSEYYIPEGVEVIGSHSFEKCDKIQRLHFPSTIKQIQTGAFNDCKSVITVWFEGTLFQYLQIEWDCFISNSHSLCIKDVLTTTLNIPEGITEIKKYAFYYCNNISFLNLPTTLRTIGRDAFNKSNLGGDIIIPKGVIMVDEYAFFSTNIKSVSISESVKVINHSAFSACDKLSSIQVNPSNEIFSSADNRLLIGNGKVNYSVVDNSVGNHDFTYKDYNQEIIAFASGNINRLYNIPTSIQSIEKDAFCFDTLGEYGIFIQHEIDYIHDDVFRKAEGKVYVLPKLKPYYYDDIPHNILDIKFDNNYAFKTDIHKITAIAENPYRILGVYANASQKEITANARKIKRYIEVGKAVDFPSDLNKFLPPLKRTTEMVDKALAEIATNDGKLKHALFWFVKIDDIDDIALGHLQNNNIQKAKEIWEKKEKWNYKKNISALALLYLEAEMAYMMLDEALWGEHGDYRNYKELLNAISVDSDIDETDIEDTFIEQLLIDYNLLDIWALFKDDYSYLTDWKIEKQLKQSFIAPINQTIQEAKSIGVKDFDGSFRASAKLSNLVNGEARDYIVYFGDEEADFKLLLDKLSDQLLQSTINFYNASSDPYCVTLAVHFAEQALQIAQSQLRKDRCQKNLEILRRNAEALPPEEIKKDLDELDELLSIHSSTAESIQQAYILLRDSVSYIRKIKEFIEKTTDTKKKDKSKELLETISTNIVAMSLNKLVKSVNAATGLKFRAEESIQQAWEVTLSMDNFPMQPTFKNNRFKQNRDTLLNLFKQAHPWKSTESASTYKILEVRTDEEVWKLCTTIGHYRYYIATFTPAKHLDEANAKIRRLIKEEEDNYWFDTQRTNTTKAYEGYLKKYPHGAYALVAKQKIEALDNAAFEACNQLNKYKDYLQQFPNGEHKAEAEAYIKEAEEKLRKDKVQKGVLIWLIAAFVITIALTILYIFISQEAFIGWTIGGVFGYLMSLIIYIGKKTGNI